ncbi:MAG: DUF1153 domain-containing protein [Kiloniellales bacterium]|nr:DUF1153 domain-containing protein [Kiloniellales bacterium]
MQLRSPGRPNSVIGPAGRPMTINDLPPPNTKRWVVRRKAEVVTAVRAGLLTLEEACERYSLSVEEFLSWQTLIERHGMRGLRTTKLKEYRRRATRTQDQSVQYPIS